MTWALRVDGKGVGSVGFMALIAVGAGMSIAFATSADAESADGIAQAALAATGAGGGDTGAAVDTSTRGGTIVATGAAGDAVDAWPPPSRPKAQRPTNTPSSVVTSTPAAQRARGLWVRSIDSRFAEVADSTDVDGSCGDAGVAAEGGLSV